MAEYSNDTLAEMHIHENLVNLLRQSDEIVKVFVEVVEGLQEDKDFEKIYNKIHVPKTRIEENRIMFMEYLIRLGDTLRNRQNYIALANGIEKFIQLLDGATYRLSLFRRKGYHADNEIYNMLKELATTIVSEYRSIYDGLTRLKTDPKKALISIRDLSKLENKADELYRELTFTIYSKYQNQIVPLMVLKDAIEFMENTADLLKSMGEELRYLALYRILIT
ncbi:MAG: DUF47 domain-containing protein [Staphylothermus sp.]|nr:DUF47 domain-containing protein [Staphylothermus sp.]